MARSESADKPASLSSIFAASDPQLRRILIDGHKGAPTEAELRAAERKRKVRDEVDARRERLRASGIGEGAVLGPGDVERVTTGKGLEPKPALQLVRGWVEAPRRRPWLVAVGGTGIGKTVAAAWLIARDEGARYLAMSELARMHAPLLRGLAPATIDEAESRLSRLAKAPVLVLDELARDPGERDAFHWLVEHRQGLGDALTLVLGNVTAAELRERLAGRGDLRYRYDPRTASRLKALVHRDVRGGGIHELGGADMRGADL
jgi:hypothetical protein